MARQHTDTPPYVPRKGLRAVLDSLQAHNEGQVITRDELHKRGVSAHLIYPAMAALRFLGILDPKDRLTKRFQAFNRDKPDLASQQAIVREAYSAFFSKVQLPQPTLELVRDNFQKVYELSDRVVNSAFPLFQYLVQEAGIALTTQGANAPIADELPSAPLPDGNEHGKDESGAELLRAAAAAGEEIGSDAGIRIRHTGYQIVLNIQVTKYTSDKDIIKMIKTARRAVHLLRKAGDTH
ncbi:MAG: DUF5343 domain-containing protein [Acidobacteria bacterium]|nr:DUF5343 domain-containing protein [Acidobacteriota bacterium]